MLRRIDAAILIDSRCRAVAMLEDFRKGRHHRRHEVRSVRAVEADTHSRSRARNSIPPPPPWVSAWLVGAHRMLNKTATPRLHRRHERASRARSEQGDTLIEIRLGSLDEAPFELKPEAEVWVKRRESWLLPVEGAAQHDENRVTG